MNALLAVEIPPVSHVTIWESGPLGLNKTVLIYLFAMVATMLVFYLGTRRKEALVPAGIFQNTAESGVAFVRNNIIMQTIGVDGLYWLPYLTTLFFFIFFSNITEIIPGVQFPANARFGVPAVLAILSWIFFNVVGIAKQGPLHYLKSSTVPPGVPKPLVPLIFIIEFVSTFLVRPFSLAVRLFANMLAGHLILVTFATLTAALFAANALAAVLPFSFALLVAMTAFEILVSFLQAFIFTILTAVYIGLALHPEH